jgi:hypothetical protein
MIGVLMDSGYSASAMTQTSEENRGKQIAVGVGILLVLTVLVCGSLLGWRYLPGLLGEWIGMMIGVMTTPFFLETSFVIIGLSVVFVLNHLNQKRAGSDFVYLEQVEESDLPAGLPEQAKWAIYSEPPLAGETPSLQAQAEGAMAIGDHEAAGECIGAMTGEEMRRPETLKLRIELAKATNRELLAEELEKELQGLGATEV